MPYEIRNVDNGFKVCKKRSKRCYSNKPLPRSRAERQLKALYASEADMEGGGFFQNLLKKAFIGVSDMIVRPSGFKQSQVRYGWLRRPMDMPPLEDLAEMVASTYKSDTNEHTPEYKLVLKTPTIAVYRVVAKPNVFIIALRGTAFTDINDISADLGIVRTIVEDANTARNVRNSRRYMDDVAAIRDFQGLVDKYLRVKNPVYFGVGHSLSGAMMDELLEDGLISSAVSFNPAIERRMFAVPNDNHRIYVECDVLYNLLGKFITNGNLEVIPMANPKGDDAGAVETTKGSIECHNINTVIPLMSGKGIENNIDSMYKPKMVGLSFQDLINRNSSFGEDRFKPISSKPECEAIRNRPITMEYNPTEYNGRTYNNPMAARQAEAYDKCMRGEKDKPARPPRNDIALKGSGLLDTIVGHIGQNLANEASKGNIFGRIANTIEEGQRRREEEQNRSWNSGLLGKIGIPNPMKLFGGVRNRISGSMPSAPELLGHLPTNARKGEVFEPEIEAHASTVAVPNYASFDDGVNHLNFTPESAVRSIASQKQRLAHQIRADQYHDDDEFALYHYQQLALVRHLLQKYPDDPVRVANIVARWSMRERDDKDLESRSNIYM